MAKLHTVKAARKENFCGRGGHKIAVGEPHQYRKGRRGRSSFTVTGCPKRPVPWYATSSSKDDCPEYGG